MSKTIALLTTILMTLPARAAKSCNDELAADEVSARSVHAALLALDDPEPQSRIRAIETMLTEGRRVLRAGQGSRNLVRRMRAVSPNLFGKLFDADEGVRWAAAYVICAFRDLTMPDHLPGVLAMRSPAIEAAMLTELEAYLVDRQTQFIQHVDVEDVTEDDEGATVKLHVGLEGELRLKLAGRAPRMPRPAWLTPHPRLVVTVHERDGAVYREVQFTGTDDGTLHLNGTFELKIPATTKLEHVVLFLDFGVDGRRLESMRIEGGQLREKSGE